MSLTTTGPPTTDTWGSGAFSLTRNTLSVPDYESGTKIVRQRLLTCAGSQEGYSQRVVAFERYAFFVPLDTSTWTNPADDWATINQNVTAIQNLNTGSVLGGYGCSCTEQKASFSQWMISVAINDGSQFGMDDLAHPASPPLPTNWWQPDGDPTNTGLTHVYVGEPPVYQFYSSWTHTRVLKEHDDISSVAGASITYRSYSFIPPSNDNGVLNLRIHSQGKRYKFRIDSVVEDDRSGASQPVVETMMNQQDVFTTQVDSLPWNNLETATAYILNPLPEGQYYSITILNDDEQEVNSTAPSYGQAAMCRPNPYYADTKHLLKVSLVRCDHQLCKGDKIQIGTPVSSAATGAFGAGAGGNGWLMLTTTVLLWFLNGRW